MKCNFKQDVDNGLFKKHILKNICMLKSTGCGMQECDGEENCIFFRERQ